MSEETQINIVQLVQPMLLSAILKGEDISKLIDVIVDAQVNDVIFNKVLSSIQVPEEFQGLIDVFKLANQLDTLKAIMAAMKGQEYQPKFGIDKVIELMVSLQMINALSTALGGTQTSTSSSTTTSSSSSSSYT